MKSRTFHSGRRGQAFTMVEVLVAVSIIALLLGISVPAYSRMKGLARSSHCVSNLRQIGISLNTYLAEHGLKLPVMVPLREDINELTDLDGDGETDAIDVTLRPYVNDVISFWCPADAEKIHEKTGTSYFWNSALNGQDISAINFLGLSKNAAGIPVVADKENFHKNVGDEVNVLYVDGHVTRELTFIVDP
ncbi:MAG: prepilin-type N-terminal cleavage/methylation domain-containing protein [Verrucomicrobiae bacterium]|nr:prepilin-type N-terminal cleavage/methylation domain-containing protein [Verrucomicrobiae bacterium]MCB1086118.1 prepilin-type N-terminal cleavage/methylation domain-containing protein [Verrucomicrobiae bacterium]